MQFTLITTVLVACMTAFVSASPIPIPVQVEARAQELLPREPAVVARNPQDDPPPPPPPPPGCSKYTCV